jgi:hypothetical protein
MADAKNVFWNSIKKLLRLIFRAFVLLTYLFTRLAVVLLEAFSNFLHNILSTKPAK